MISITNNVSKKTKLIQNIVIIPAFEPFQNTVIKDKNIINNN